MDDAKKEALKSSMKSKYGAILIHRNKIISRGHNYDTHIHTDKKSCPLCP
jgi:hypothetical protein